MSHLVRCWSCVFLHGLLFALNRHVLHKSLLWFNAVVWTESRQGTKRYTFHSTITYLERKTSTAGCYSNRHIWSTTSKPKWHVLISFPCSAIHIFSYSYTDGAAIESSLEFIAFPRTLWQTTRGAGLPLVDNLLYPLSCSSPIISQCGKIPNAFWWFYDLCSQINLRSIVLVSI